MKQFYALCFAQIFCLVMCLGCLRACGQAETHIVFTHMDTTVVIVKPRDHKWIRYALFTTAVISQAVGDGENSRQHFELGHSLNALSIGAMFAVPFFTKHPNWKLPVTYIAIRYAVFDGFYNLGAARKLNYRGGKNYYNEGLAPVPLGVLNASKFAALGLSVVINLK